MKKLINIIPVLLLSVPVFCSVPSIESPEQILDKLYRTNGNSLIIKPGIVRTTDPKNTARYLRSHNVIEVSEKLIQICSKLNDPSAAMAFVLSHELSHAFQLDLKAKETSFLAYDHAPNSSEFHEEAADVSGAFLAYLSGYKSLNLIDPLIEKIYNEYDLSDNLSGYPSLEERKRTSIKVKAMIEELIQVYELGNHLSIIGQYEYALACYEHISKWYKGREILNNIGVNYAYQALNFTHKNLISYIYPLELSWTTRMKKPTLARGDELSTAELILKQELLNKSEKYLAEASKLDMNYLGAEINILCVLSLKGKGLEAMDYYRKIDLQKRIGLSNSPKINGEQLRLALALIYVQNGEKEKAIRIWKDLQNSPIDIIAVQAKYNMEVCNGISPSKEDIQCIKLPALNHTIDKIRLYRLNEEDMDSWIPIGEENKLELSIKQLAGSTIYYLKNGKRKLRLQKVACSSPVKIKSKDLRYVMLTNIGLLYHCDENRYSMLLNKEGRAIEYVRYE